MALWSDVIDPATLSGYARESLADYEARQGSLARWLPNREVADIVVRFVQGQTGLIDVARFRAYDAEPEIGRRPQAKRVTLELPALGLDIPVSEYEQLRLRSPEVSDEAALATIQNTTDAVVRSVSDAIERLRGIVLATGRATIEQDNFRSDDDFGRPDEHAYTVPNLWTDTGVSRLEDLTDLVELMADSTGQTPGSLVMSTRVFRALAAGDEFQTQLLNGGSRLASAQQVRDTVTAAELPPIYTYDRRVSVDGQRVRALRDDTILALPEAVESGDWAGTDLGATWWGRTLTSTDPAWNISAGEQPGIVAGVWRNDKPPMGVEVISDAIALPVMANAELSAAVKVL